jgi:hypothetical protein
MVLHGEEELWEVDVRLEIDPRGIDAILVVDGVA